MAKKVKIVKADEDLSEGLPAPSHLNNDDDLHEGIEEWIRYKKNKIKKVTKKK